MEDNTGKAAFIENIKKWYALESKLTQVNEMAKKIRETKNLTTKQILEYMDVNNVGEKKIALSTGEVKMVEKKEYSPLSFSYIEICLDHIISDKEQVEKIVNFLKDQRDIKITKELRYFAK